MDTSSTIKKNFAWSTLLTVSGYLFPLITFPYVTRVLGAEGIGSFQYADSVIQYFCLFALMGVNTVGIREIAKVKDNQAGMSSVFSSLLLLCLLTTLISICVLLLFTSFIPSFVAHKRMLYIGAARILSSSLLIEWLFKGLENFRFITIRAIIVRIVFVLCVFAFVKDADDYEVYFLLTVLTFVVNAIVNIFYSRRFVQFSFYRVDLIQYLKPFFILGLYQVLTAMYLSFNVIYLGAKCGDLEVGYYSAATKLYTIIMSFFTAFTGVMLPRMSSLIAEGKNDEFRIMTAKSIDVLLSFCLPIVIFSEIFAPQIIRLVAGEGYEGAIIPMRIVIPLMLVIGYEQIIVIQMLSPLNKDNAILINSCVGAGVALLLNATLVPRFGSIGSSVVWVCSELAVLLSAQFFVSKYIGYQFPYKKMFKSIIVFVPLVVLCMVAKSFSLSWILSLLIGGVTTLIYFIIIELFVLKDQFVTEYIKRILKIGSR